MRRKREARLIGGESSRRQTAEPGQVGYSSGVLNDDMHATVESCRPPEYSS
ncbi:hypothetical protein Hanom_Chr17g01575801 [Helianthus anomalus]